MQVVVVAVLPEVGRDSLAELTAEVAVERGEALLEQAIHRIAQGNDRTIAGAHQALIDHGTLPLLRCCSRQPSAGRSRHHWSLRAPRRAWRSGRTALTICWYGWVC